MIHGLVQHGLIVPLDPIPADWNGQQVTIEAATDTHRDEQTQIERWCAGLEALGPAQFEPGERETIEAFMAQADHEAREFMRQSWAGFNDVLPAGHQPSERGPER